jgi:hypothetical protein
MYICDFFPVMLGVVHCVCLHVYIGNCRKYMSYIGRMTLNNCGVRGNCILVFVVYDLPCVDVCVLVFVRDFVYCLTLMIMSMCFDILGR